ncbi:hypothetical protein [Bacteroides eggerthii]|uniref:Uncharacterized protein n=1 Tax=Bacteroides eggerthii TaxID=28111 RepID=A0A380YPK3_9BACE|nr:hypothetical protein [Bacteroides eggerthii]EEC53799.1 hypothetical protein BACEGG_01944 [Bacteroides eggerthii DSM 20697]QRQ50205.1 hypothetical protein I6J51_07935 [Bacteroides eggerthii]UWN87434.1 hypothetical protein NQ546_14860 [Bacteroides eggerthii]SUV29870.1 Uncharacterised protein [Bacteroides eggerthii]
MNKNIPNNRQIIDKKIFVAGKVYDLLAMDKDTVEASVQADLDSYAGKDKVRFELYTIGNAVAMFFHRGFDYTPYNADPTKDIMDADAFMMTAHGYNGFWMPSPFPMIPGCIYPYHIRQTDFLDAYRRSAKILGASRIKNASLDISPVSAILRVQV